MAYSIATNVRELLPRVTTNALSNDVVTNMIVRADNIINGKLATRYTVPFSTTPPLIATISADLAAYFCLRTLYTQDTDNENDWVYDFYKSAMDLLNQLADSKIILLDSEGTAISEASSVIWSNTMDYPTTFNMDDVEDQKISSNLLEAISDERDE